MTTFDKREMAEEGRFVAQENANFQVRALRDRLLGAWAAEQLGLTGAAAENYAKSILSKDLESHGDADIVAKLKADFAAARKNVSEQQINNAMAEKKAEALKQAKTKT